MNHSQQQSPIWPYLGILAFLFLLSLTAPRAWERQSRREVGRVVTGNPGSERVPYLDFSVGSETSDENEPDSRAAQLELSQQADASPAGDAERAAGIIPPAPEFADDVRDQVDVARLPSGPADAEPDMELPDEEPDLAAPLATSGWPLPRVLIEQLTSLVHEDPQLVWVQRALELVRELCQDPTDGDATRKTLESLRELADRDSLAPPADPSLKGDIIRARYALARWIDIWSAAAALAEIPIDQRLGQSSPEKISLCLADFDTMAGKNPAGAAWRDYLQLQALGDAAAAGQSDLARRAAARAVLDRLASNRLTRAQRRFVGAGPLADLQRELRAWAAEPVAAAQLLAHLDQYEYSGLASDAHLVADDFRGLSWSAPEQAEQLSEQLDTHYRNANVRVTVSGALIDRLLPQPGRIEERVRDTVVNVPVRGRVSTFTKLTVELVPDPRRIRLGLEARGVVASNTVASSGPATFHNSGQSSFLVRKLFVLGPQGLTVWPAIAEAENDFNYLISMETGFDGVPLVGSLVRSIARNQHDESRSEASRQTAEKVAIRALHQLDSETSERLVEAGKNIENNQVATLRRLGLELTPISLSTTPQRVVARARLSTPEQLGAHTPRPRAPSDSWFSWQLHQSALNNGLAQLDLEGRSFELPELFRWVAKKLGRPELAEQEDLPEDVQLTFADKDAVRLRCENGQVEVTIMLAELEHEGSRWRDFQVRTNYSPEADGLSPRFVRKDTIYLDGRSLKGKLELKLRAIFSRVLSKNRDLKLLDDSVTGDPRVQDLQITQFSVVDGWIALAYSPRRASSHVARQPE